MAKNEISSSRKFLYYGGMVLIAIGLIIFFSNFVRLAMGDRQSKIQMPSIENFGTEDFSVGGFEMESSSGPNMMGPSILGIVLIGIGGVMRTIGVRGAAGSGLILNPKQAREDLKPWTKMAGGMVDDVLGETSIGAKDKSQGSVKVRCTGCRALNDEDSRFCKACGQGI